MRIIGTIATLVLVLGAGISGTALAAGTTSVSINAPDKVAPDSGFTATVDINGVTDLNAVQYDISFNPSVLRLDNVTAGRIDTTTISAMFNEIREGTVRVVQSMGLGIVSGSGCLAELHFYIIGSPGDSSDIAITDGVISGMAGEITATWVRDSVQVVSGESDSQSPTASATTEPEAGNKEELPLKASLSESATTEPEAGDKEELPPKTSLSPESATTDAPNIASGPKPPPPSPRAQSESEDWPALWGVVGGVVVVIGLFIFFQLRRRSY